MTAPDVWADETALYIWSESKADLAMIKAAKANLVRIDYDDVDFRVRPIAVGSLADLPDLDARVLAIGSRPPFVCNYALVGEKTTLEGFVRALRWIFRGAEYDDPKATTVIDIFRSIMGPGVSLLPQDQLDSERKMREYQKFEEETPTSYPRVTPKILKATEQQNNTTRLMALREGIDLDKVGDSERASRVLEPTRPVEVSELGRSPKQIATTALALGWEVRAWVTLKEFDPVLFVAASEEGAENPHLAGDLRFEGYVAREYVVEARHGATRLGFQALWSGKGADGNSASFEWVVVHDPVGIPVENWYAYPPIKPRRGVNSQGRVVETEASFKTRLQLEEERAADARARYNDGFSRLEKRVAYGASSDFTRWLDDWLEMSGLDTISRKQRATKAEQNATALVEGGEWNG